MDIDDLFGDDLGGDDYRSPSNDTTGAGASSTQRQNDDILGLEKEIKLRARKKLVTLNAEKLLSRNGLPYLYDHRKKLRYLHKNRSDYNPKDYTTHYSYKNLSMILEFYQLWAHKLFPKARFRDAVMLANRPSSGNAKNVKYFRTRLIEQEMKELFPDEEIEANQNDMDNGIDVVLSDTAMNEYSTTGTTLASARAAASAAEQPEYPHAMVPSGNSLFVADDDDNDSDDNLYRTSKTRTTTTQAANTTLLSDDEFNDDLFTSNATSRPRKTNNVLVDDDEEEEETPNLDQMHDMAQNGHDDHEDELEALREMGM